MRSDLFALVLLFVMFAEGFFYSLFQDAKSVEPMTHASVGHRLGGHTTN